MIVDPWGVVLAQAPDTETFITAELDFARLEEIRRSVPSLANRRPQSYAWPQEVAT
jgi:predicted amidohydrolase